MSALNAWLFIAAVFGVLGCFWLVLWWAADLFSLWLDARRQAHIAREYRIQDTLDSLNWYALNAASENTRGEDELATWERGRL